MPFRYFGGKKALARHYPAPLHNRIIEPFAGSAGYSLWHATADTEVILVERDARLGLWAQTRPGQVIVCEQTDATWLPFRPFRKARTTASASHLTAVEAIWTNGGAR
jgi:hypothetical protein